MRRYQRLFCLLIILVSLSCEKKFEIDQTGATLFTSIPSGYSNLTFKNDVVQTRENNHLLNVEFVSGGGIILIWVFPQWKVFPNHAHNAYTLLLQPK